MDSKLYHVHKQPDAAAPGLDLTEVRDVGVEIEAIELDLEWSHERWTNKVPRRTLSSGTRLQWNTDGRMIRFPPRAAAGAPRAWGDGTTCQSTSEWHIAARQ
jgi:hypothetical protein